MHPKIVLPTGDRSRMPGLMNIFIVDDNALIVQLLTRVCEEAGHSVSSADDGYDALDAIIATIPDVAFIDLIMPRVGGDTLSRIIRRIPACDACRIVLMSAAATEMEIDLDHAGADYFLAKGATRTMIANVLKVLDGLTAADPSRDRKPAALGMDDVLKRRITTELLSRRQHLQEVLNTVFNGVVEISDGKIVYANTAAVYLLGHPLEKLLNTEFAEHFPWEKRSLLNRFLDGGSGSLPEAISLNNRIVNVRRPTAPSEAPSVVVLLVDVTDAENMAAERARSQQRLEERVGQRRWQLESTNARLKREAEARAASLASLEAEDRRFDRFMHYLPAAAFIKDGEGRYVYVNDAFCHTFKVARADCLGHRDLDFLDAAAAEQMEKNDRSVRTRESSLSTVEVVGRGDTRAYFVTTRFPIFTKSEAMLLGGVSMDITGQKRLAEEQFEIQRHIHRLRKMEAIGVLAGEMAHELNNLLSGLVSYPDYLLTLDEALPPGFKEKIQRTKQAGERAAAVVTDVLHLAGGDMQKRVRLDLNRVVMDCLGDADARRSVPDRIRVERAPAAAPVGVRGTEGLLCKVIRRLLDYGAANIGAGDGVIRFGVETLSLESALQGFQTVPAGDYGVIHFEETGPPLSREEKEHLFEPFFLKSRLSRIDSGLWMSVIWGIVKAHGGHVSLEAAPGGGNRFRFFFPLQPEDSVISFRESATEGSS